MQGAGSGPWEGLPAVGPPASLATTKGGEVGGALTSPRLGLGVCSPAAGRWLQLERCVVLTDPLSLSCL